MTPGIEGLRVQEPDLEDPAAMVAAEEDLKGWTLVQGDSFSQRCSICEMTTGLK